MKGITSRHIAARIDAVLDEWREDPDMTPAEQALIYIEQIVDRTLGRKERQHFGDDA